MYLINLFPRAPSRGGARTDGTGTGEERRGEERRGEERTGTDATGQGGQDRPINNP